jgi:protein involved in polysaccharide export with SLBB domain
MGLRKTWRWLRMGFGGLCVVLLLVVVAGMSAGRLGAQESPEPKGAEQEEDIYRLGPQDRLRIRIFEWRAALDQIYAWEAFNEDYLVGARGQVALPLAGEIEADGLSTRELADAISRRVQERMGLARAPDTAVEVIEYRPFFISGSVERPGPYPYRPGLTVLQALSIGGGVMRLRDGSAAGLIRDAITSSGEAGVLGSRLDQMAARAARLEAERDGTSELAWPGSLVERAGEPELDAILAREKSVFDARKTAFDTQTSALRQLRAFLLEEVDTLNAQREVHARQVSLVRAERDRIRELEQRGLTTSPRRLELERTMAQLEAEGLTLQSRVVRARQDISRAELSLIELEAQRSGEAAVMLQQVRADFDETLKRREVAVMLARNAQALGAPGLVLQQALAMRPTFEIVRKLATGSQRFPATDAMLVRPGDVVHVEIQSQVAQQTTPIPETPTLSERANRQDTLSTFLRSPDQSHEQIE